MAMHCNAFNTFKCLLSECSEQLETKPELWEHEVIIKMCIGMKRDVMESVREARHKRQK